MRKFAIVVFVLLMLLPMSVFATRGVGIKYGIEYAKFYSGQENCLTYKVYNPWDEDVAIELVAGGELEELFDRTNQVYVPAHTSNKDALPLEICFDIPKVSKRSCSKTQYKGEVIAKEASTPGVSGTGSATSVVAAASLTIDLVCSTGTSAGTTTDTYVGDISLRDGFYVIFGAISLAALTFLVKVYGKMPERKRKKYMKKYHELRQLEGDLTYDPTNQEKRQRYNDLWGELQQLRREF